MSGGEITVRSHRRKVDARTPVDRNNAAHYTARIMTADVAQAVAALQLTLQHVDQLDDMVRLAKTSAAREVATRERETARGVLRQRRAELDTILLGPDE
jgi:hypothetical protein